MTATRKPWLTRRRILLFALALLILSGLAWLTLSPRDPLFHGKPESQWITNIVYGMGLSDDQNREQAQRWRDFGPDGLHVLEKGLSAKRGRAYQNFHRRLASFLPGPLLRILPTPPPKTMVGTRLLVMDLLCRMGKDAHPAWPAVARALSDEDPWVRGRAITFFTGPEPEQHSVAAAGARVQSFFLANKFKMSRNIRRQNRTNFCGPSLSRSAMGSLPALAAKNTMWGRFLHDCKRPSVGIDGNRGETPRL